MTEIIEILLYKLTPGTGPSFFRIMQEISVPLHRAHGIDVVWHGQSMHDPDHYGLIRAFRDMADLEAAQANFYASDAWRSGPREEIVASIDTASRIVVPMAAEGIEGLRKQGYFQNCQAP